MAKLRPAVVAVRGRVGQCDACHRSFPFSLLTPIGEGALQACPRCAAEARQVVRTEPRKLMRLVKPA